MPIDLLPNRSLASFVSQSLEARSWFMKAIEADIAVVEVADSKVELWLAFFCSSSHELLTNRIALLLLLLLLSLIWGLWLSLGLLLALALFLFLEFSELLVNLLLFSAGVFKVDAFEEVLEAMEELEVEAEDLMLEDDGQWQVENPEKKQTEHWMAIAPSDLRSNVADCCRIMASIANAG